MNEKNYYKKVSINPFINSAQTASLKLFWLWIALVPQIVMLFVTGSYFSIFVIAAAILGSLASNIREICSKENLQLTFAVSIVSGTLIGFFLPPQYPLASVFFITALTLFLVKKIFGPVGQSWISPVVFSLTVFWFIGHFLFPEFQISLSELAGKNPSLYLIQNGTFRLNTFDEKITVFLNDTVFSLFDVSIPNGYVSLFWDSQSVIPAFRFTFFTILASIFLLALDVQETLVPVIYIVVYSLLVKFVSPFFTQSIMFQGDMLLSMLSGGTFFAAFFLIQWPGTMPYKSSSKLFYAVCGSILAFIFCGTGASPVGHVITVLFMNILSPVIQLIEQNNDKKLLSNLINTELKTQVKDGE